MASSKEIKSYIKEIRFGDEMEVYFVQMTWPTSHTPETEDVLLFRMPLAVWETEKPQYYSLILNNKNYFRICGGCMKITHVGHMHDEYICQGCAEKHLRIIH